MTRNQKTSGGLRLELESLDSRILPTVSANFANGILTVTGDSNANQIWLTTDANNEIIVNTNLGQITVTNGPPTTANTNTIKIYGLGGDDIIWLNQLTNWTGVDTSTEIWGGSGNDNIIGYAGTDTIHGDEDNDTLDGGDGSDSIYGGNGADELSGGSEGDYLHGGGGTDSLFGEAGNDTMFGGTENDDLWGGEGNDRMEGLEHQDWLYGGAGNDTIFGFSGDDTLLGGSGSDSLMGGLGSDYIYNDTEFTTDQDMDIIWAGIAGAGGEDGVRDEIWAGMNSDQVNGLDEDNLDQVHWQ